MDKKKSKPTSDKKIAKINRKLSKGTNLERIERLERLEKALVGLHEIITRMQGGVPVEEFLPAQPTEVEPTPQPKEKDSEVQEVEEADQVAGDDGR